MDEVMVYCLHISQEEFGKIFKGKKIIEAAKKTKAAIAEVPKNPLEYCATFVFKHPRNRVLFADALKEMGVRYKIEILPARAKLGDNGRPKDEVEG